MQNSSAIAFIGFIAWTLLLLLLMVSLRVRLVLSGKMTSAGFRSDNANLSPFMQRLARAHANCIENLPLFGGLLLLALGTHRAALTDPLAFALLGARIVQSCVHLGSIGAAAVNLRFSAFLVQVAIAGYWICRLSLSFFA
jgi:uncharacterized MAPEG superfamily protein